MTDTIDIEGRALAVDGTVVITASRVLQNVSVGQHLIPDGAARDLGTTEAPWRDGWFSRSVTTPIIQGIPDTDFCMDFGRNGNINARMAQYSNNSVCPGFITRKARGTEENPSAVVSGDTLLRFRGTGHDGSMFRTGTEITATALNDWGTFSPTTAWDFWTLTNGGSALRMRVSDRLFFGSTANGFSTANGARFAGTVQLDAELELVGTVQAPSHYRVSIPGAATTALIASRTLAANAYEVIEVVGTSGSVLRYRFVLVASRMAAATVSIAVVSEYTQPLAAGTTVTGTSLGGGAYSIEVVAAWASGTSIDTTAHVVRRVRRV